MRVFSFAVVSLATVLGACVDDTFTDADGSSGAPSTADAGPDSSAIGSASVAGTVGGNTFTLKSSLAYRASSGIDIVFSTAADVCSASRSQLLRPGETVIMLYGLEGTTPGKVTSPEGDIKYAAVSPNCPAGAPADGEISNSSRISASTIEITAVTASAVSGKVDLTFQDGSRLTGSFSAPACEATVLETAVCQ